ncbi:MAG: hypothetical protein QOE46_793 [Acidobacteriota bacterium]|jgi:hypothetical protein|nr:hypothetical protein [Acidobacteriota bacterium]
MHAYRFIMRSGTSFTIKAATFLFKGDKIVICDENGKENGDVVIYASEVAAVIPTELLVDESASTAS